MQKSSPNHKILIYQILPRIFGNTNTTFKPYGSIEENGCGKFNDITEKVLIEIKKMGFTHVWYIGVIEHATMTDYSEYGIKPDDPDVVKGRAGSPYAIKDYYDVDPDLAVDVRNRMAEYEALIKRTHDRGLKVIMDFVPNHVARTYKSDAKPKDVHDFGEDDDTSVAFSPKNDFYYHPGQAFVVPGGYEPGGFEFKSPMKDGKFDEYPAKGTGDDVLTASPSIFNWFETVKLNYGINFHDSWRTHFEPVPPLWHKMLGILSFWADKGIDAFRCDMVELVPMEFWDWVTTHMKKKYPDILFIGEAYNPNEYRNYLFGGGFDYLYDKVGLYDSLKCLIRNEHGSSTWEINAVWHHHCNGFDERMLRFLENHDEQRIACPDFAGDPWLAIPGMIVTATLNAGPVMVYFGQEVGEPAAGVSGFSGDDGRTTIFDYWAAPEHQKWMNGEAFDGGKLSESQRKLREFYCKLLNIVKNSEAISKGKFYELMVENEKSEGFNTKLYIYLRYTEKERILVLVNFNRHENKIQIWMPHSLLEELQVSGAVEFKDMLTERKYSTNDIAKGVSIALPASSGVLLKF